LVAVIDAADAPLVAAFSWYPLHKKSNGAVYAQTAGGVLMHRLIAGAGGDVRVDHRDNDGLNNRRENLLASQSQNRSNSRKLAKCDSAALQMFGEFAKLNFPDSLFLPTPIRSSPHCKVGL
jgi:hypothetical protein